MQRETDRLRSSRDRAIIELLLRTGRRIGELADLDVGEVRLTQRTGELIIRHGKATAAASSHSTARPEPRCGHGSPTARATRRPGTRSRAAVISRPGEHLSVRSITKLVTSVMAAADVDETADGLRHTLATRLVRDHGRDLALVADVLGHADAKTTRATRAPNSRTAAPHSKRSTADTPARRTSVR